ncbi:heavy-metal-associated domain-containing protein [Emticicia sp. CRIBPO]|jgi:mercuric ion binding protein|uniref:heavy-metal-associated domain-containing protein n=1 Tax=Emticicia sp. CRIBPO TaxID=2683258 RepID=UPI0014122892|nr:heavy metal-associated domain-containing protein [Emticicia sp. CRIBPO]NBA87421.1 heavy-metal-associated domain-containing protein [Emticicia sp. CRIBPO]
MKKIAVLFVMFGLISFGSNAQKASVADQVEIKTSAVCGMCKKRIERDLGLTKGIESANLNLDDKVVTVKFNPKKTNAAKIKQQISKIGYDADEVVANQKSHDALPDCCQKTAKAHVD